MKPMFKIILIVLIGGIVLFFGFSAFIMYQTRSSEEIIEERFHKNGNIAMQKVEGYDCCEGFYEKTIIYDDKGRKIEEYGNRDGSRFKEVFQYQDSIITFEGYYTIDNDSLANNFEVNEARISSLSETEYYPNQKVKLRKLLSFYEDWNNRDTSSLEIENFDSLGRKTIWKEFRNERDYVWNEQLGEHTKIIQAKVIEDKIRSRVDTIEIIEFEIKEK
jgi:hypothetical protein